MTIQAFCFVPDVVLLLLARMSTVSVATAVIVSAHLVVISFDC